jgi:hypothetical protein
VWEYRQSTDQQQNKNDQKNRGHEHFLLVVLHQYAGFGAPLEEQGWAVLIKSDSTDRRIIQLLFASVEKHFHLDRQQTRR